MSVAAGAAGLRVWSHTGGYVCETRPALQSTPDGSWELFCRCSSTAVLRRYCRGGSKHWGEDGRLTRLAQTGVLDWETSVARGGAEGTARKAGAVAPTEDSGAEAANKTVSLHPLSPLAIPPLSALSKKRGAEESM